ncbi:hypothetical chloroplast RF68 [Olea europaea subsp. europaea]|uniref:Uncharacterized protein ycf68 n=1 Tax=Olea europaea subsp. europaea TaxID=158383 RepID=A0A8S0URN4_OLEEU|nr:hypothetical chloroplast RF68 [Olea europaea subsp. europaea]
MGFGRSGGTTAAPLFSRIHTSLIGVWTAISRAQDDRGHSSLFFHAFSGGLEKVAIKRTSLILPSRKEECEILFLFAGTRILDLPVRRMLGINNSLLGLRPPESL